MTDVSEETRLALRALAKIRAVGRRSHTMCDKTAAEMYQIAVEALAAIEMAADARVSGRKRKPTTEDKS
jgi:hypothetical protein